MGPLQRDDLHRLNARLARTYWQGRPQAGVGTGFFGYNGGIGMWTLTSVPAASIDTSWAQLALQPADWPLLSETE